MSVQKGSNLRSCLISIKIWHVAIHKDEIVIAKLIVVVHDVFSNYIYCLLAVEGTITNLLHHLDVKLVFKNYLDGSNVKNFVVNNENLTFVVRQYILLGIMKCILVLNISESWI